jgi:DNA-directed RNA polymerase subunit RPC12/RpoP
MGSQPIKAAFHLLPIPCGNCNAELTYKIGVGTQFMQMGGQAVVCPDCAAEIRPHVPGPILAGPFVASHYGKQTHVACKKCGRNIFVTSATAFLRNGERHVELICNSPTCAHTDIYNEVELEIHGN